MKRALNTSCNGARPGDRARHLLRRRCFLAARLLAVGFRRCAVAVFCFASWFGGNRAHANSPYNTDDAGIVGHKRAQLETWVLADRFALEHNALAALGITERIELTLGVLHGGIHSGSARGYSIAGPLLQAKVWVAAARDNAWPGFAVVAGVLPPWGVGAFTPPGWCGYGYSALTESLFEERLLLHANLGVVVGDVGESRSEAGVSSFESSGVRTQVTAGVGFLARIVAGLHVGGEVYFGNPCDPRFGQPSFQIGSRYIFDDNIEIDATFGSSFTAVAGRDGELQTWQWVTIGLRLVSDELW